MIKKKQSLWLKVRKKLRRNKNKIKKVKIESKWGYVIIVLKL